MNFLLSSSSLFFISLESFDVIFLVLKKLKNSVLFLVILNGISSLNILLFSKYSFTALYIFGKADSGHLLHLFLIFLLTVAYFNGQNSNFLFGNSLVALFCIKLNNSSSRSTFLCKFSYSFFSLLNNLFNKSFLCITKLFILSFNFSIITI